MMFQKRSVLPAQLLLLVAGCGGSQGDEQRVWRTDSVAFELEYNAPQRYSNKYLNDHPSAEQLRALRGLRLVTPESSCGADGETAVLTVHDSDGTARDYGWTGLARVGDNRDCFDGEPVLEAESFEPLLAAIPDCRGSDSRVDDLPLDGCMDPAFGGQVIGEKTLRVVAGERYRIGLTGCTAGLLTLEEEGGAILAESASGTGDDCARVEHTFAAAGNYVIRSSRVEPVGESAAWLYGENLTD